MLWLKAFCFIIAFTWSLQQSIFFVTTAELAVLTNFSLTHGELVSLLHFIVVGFGFHILFKSLLLLNLKKTMVSMRQVVRFFTHREILMISALSVFPQGSSQTVSISTDAGVPIRTVIQPALAIALVKRLLQKQQIDFKNFASTIRLTEESAHAIHTLRRSAVEAQRHGVVSREFSLEELDNRLSEIIDFEPTVPSVVQSWDVVIRLYGCPYVESRSGVRAVFDKNRSIEVLAWLGMNMDRPRRSAVRTAVWDVEISDASFSTVMSDIRRGISSVACERERKEVFPPTFTDSIEIGVGLVTDFDLISSSLHDFRRDSSFATSLANELNLVRDIPFAGVNYMWADLDGTTTRMVMLVLQASCELAEWARENNDVEMCWVAVRAGLRVMPGHEELLAIQNSFISQRSMSQG